MPDPVGRGAAETAATDAARRRAIEAAAEKLSEWMSSGMAAGFAELAVDAVLAAVGSDTPTYEPIPGWMMSKLTGHIHHEDSHGVCVECEPIFRRVFHTDSSGT